MGKVLFYHLTQSTAEQTTRMLAQRCLQMDLRCVIVADTQDQLHTLDDGLWLGTGDEFLPHAIADANNDGGNDAHNRILLTLPPAPKHAHSGRDVFICVGNAAISADDIDGYERACFVFDGGDAGAVDAARARWTAFKDHGAQMEYWAQDHGRWQMKTAVG